jgi:hypothetical protein
MRKTPGASRAFYYKRIIKEIPKNSPRWQQRLAKNLHLNDKSDLPPGWAMPDDLAKKLSDAFTGEDQAGILDRHLDAFAALLDGGIGQAEDDDSG